MDFYASRKNRKWAETIDGYPQFEEYAIITRNPDFGKYLLFFKTNNN